MTFSRALRNWYFATTTEATATDPTTRQLAWKNLRESEPVEEPQHLMFSYAGLGYEDSLAWAVQQTRQKWSSDRWSWPDMLDGIAVCYAIAGQKEKALDALSELAELEMRFLYSHRSHLDRFFFDPLRDDPRFQELAENW